MVDARATLVEDISCAACDGAGCVACGYTGHKPAGSFEWAVDTNGQIVNLVFVCPCGCGKIFTVPVSAEHGDGWHWGGNREAPTLHPSLNILSQDGGSHWHGWLQNGEWRRC